MHSPFPHRKATPVLEGGDSSQDRKAVWSTGQDPPAIEQWEILPPLGSQK